MTMHGSVNSGLEEWTTVNYKYVRETSKLTIVGESYYW